MHALSKLSRLHSTWSNVDVRRSVHACSACSSLFHKRFTNVLKLTLSVYGCSNAALSDGSVTDLVKGILLFFVGTVP